MTVADYPNFYENLREAQMRLLNTVVLYDGEPYTVLAITNHKKDGIFRMYLLPIASAMTDDGTYTETLPGVAEFRPEDNGLGSYLDKWLEDNPKTKIIRKQMNSPLFNKFRPFPLGMWHRRDQTWYLARQPQRHREQGLTRSHIRSYLLSLTPGLNAGVSGGFSHHVAGPSMRDTILGKYPDIRTCIKGLVDPDGMEVEPRASVAFHRDFALLSAPLDTLFLFYKTDPVGLVEYSDTSVTAVLAEKFKYLKEVTENTNCFSVVIIK